MSCVMCHVSCVTCHLSRVTYHQSPVTCHLSPVTHQNIYFLNIKKRKRKKENNQRFVWTKWWSLSVEALLSTEPTQSSFLLIPFLHKDNLSAPLKSNIGLVSHSEYLVRNPVWAVLRSYKRKKAKTNLNIFGLAGP